MEIISGDSSEKQGSGQLSPTIQRWEKWDLGKSVYVHVL